MRITNVFSIFIVSSLVVFSCNKEKELPNQSIKLIGESEIVITGTLDKELTKTSYDAEGKMTWLNTDQIALVVNNNGTVTNQNRYSLSVQSISNEGKTATFSTLVDKHKVASGWLSTGFAVYPTTISQVNDNSGYDKPFVKLPFNVNGLLSSVILVGTPDNDTPADVTNFLFKTATSILKITLNNIPANASELRLCTNNGSSYPVDGDFSLVKSDGLVTIGNGNYYGWGKGYQSIAISDGVEIASRDFYFNVPVADYPEGTLYVQLRDANGGQIMRRTINKDLSVSRNECVSLPEITMSHEITVGGDVQTPRVVWSIDSQQFRFAVNQKSTLDLEDFPDGYRFTNSGNGRYTSSGSGYPYGYAMSALSPNPLSSSGLYYMHFVVLSDISKPSSVSDANVVKYGTVPFYYISLSDVSSYVGDFTCTYTDGGSTRTDNPADGVICHPGTGSGYDATMKLAVSDDTSKGNIKLTYLYKQTAESGHQIYGCLNSANNSLVFPYPGDTATEDYFFVSWNSNYFHIASCETVTFSGNDLSSTATGDLEFSISAGSLTHTDYLMMKYTNSGKSYTTWDAFVYGKGLVFTK